MAKTYPFKKYNYMLEISSVTVASFSEVSGFDATIDVIEYREGADEINSPRKMPGLTKYGNITLKWGISNNQSFYEWVSDISSGEKSDIESRVCDVTISLMDDKLSSTLASWTLRNAWPCKYTAPDLNASSSEIAFESVEMAFEEMKRNNG